MFMGHYGPAVWDSQRGQGQPLLTIWQGFLAVQAIDIVFALLALFGIEGATLENGLPVFSIQWSHSLLTSIMLSILTAGLFLAFKPSLGRKGFLIVSALAFSHWVFDLIVHRPDLPLYPGSDVIFGFGLWNFPIIAFILEISLLFAGLLFWVRVTTPKSILYKFAPWALFVFMCVLQYVFITKEGLAVAAGTFDPAGQLTGPALGATALFAFLFLALLVGLIERGRIPINVKTPV